MIVFFGTRLYGKVDQIPGMCHVATQFAHIQLLPLIPLGSYLVHKQSDGQYAAWRIPLSLKSILTAWFRVACVLAGATGAIFVAVAAAENDISGAVVASIPTAMALGGLVLTYVWSPIARARYERALELATAVGMSDEGRLAIEIIYGHLTADEAGEELERREQEAALERREQEAVIASTF